MNMDNHAENKEPNSNPGNKSLACTILHYFDKQGVQDYEHLLTARR